MLWHFRNQFWCSIIYALFTIIQLKLTNLIAVTITD